jgi:hypothetical protein
VIDVCSALCSVLGNSLIARARPLLSMLLVLIYICSLNMVKDITVKKFDLLSVLVSGLPIFWLGKNSVCIVICSIDYTVCLVLRWLNFLSMLNGEFVLRWIMAFLD